MPKKAAYLSSDSRIVIPCTCLEKGYQFPPNAGIFSVIESATLSTASSGPFAQVSESAGELYANMNLLTPPERKLNVDSVLHGVNFVMETGSGSKLNANKADAEKLAGQYRLICDKYNEKVPSTRVKGRNNCKPNWLNGEPAFKLETDVNKTPQYSIALADLFPGLFSHAFQFPLGLIQEDVFLDITFSQNAGRNNNSRAVFCPSLSTQTKNSMISVGVVTKGQGAAAATDVVLANPTSSLQDPKGSGLRLMVDIVDDGNGDFYTENVRIIDGGKGYQDGEELIFAHAQLGTQNMIVMAASKFKTWDSVNNWYVDNDGAGYATNDVKVVTHPTNPDLNFNIKVTGQNAGALTSCVLASVDDNNNLSVAANYDTPYEVEGGAALYLIKQNITFTNAAGAGAFVVGDIVVDHAAATNMGVVAVIDGNGRPTQLKVIKGSFADGTRLDKQSDANAVYCTLTQITTASADRATTTTNGLGLDPVFNFDNNNESDGKINIETGQVMLVSDLIYYFDGKLERDMKQMMEGGINVNYTQFLPNKSDLTGDADVSDYGQSDPQSHNRLIGFANETVRTIMFNLDNSGTVPGDVTTSDLPYVGQDKINPLLNKYHSRASLVQDGLSWNLNINSIPWYSSKVETDMRMFREANKMFGKFYLNKGQYQAWNQARQDKWTTTLTDGAPSAQPGFTTLDSNTEPTLQYEINDRKAGIVNQGWNGISQKWLRGMHHMNGVSFKMSDQNVPDNGVRVGAQQLDITIDYDSTYDPWYSGQCTLSLFGEVERRMTIHKGKIAVTAASY